ncbi:MAG: phosphate/phosphite/phosphonate ABC transporter substrate-binding protein [Phreatobacter sp.]|uniref:phosphate/phosphite/phosphonate ABC transporter substrate-binding protein n=1 Tax=Phreatobacter sp. TaxID=1966341 RepID=UPI002735B6E0|nr:phosphate/phosphite/phosphonate ABC transporter substrate-binding protein [Phreatobacter sp.]MDP2802851.1 phosphate/phosphite/phosphonate ABC transporter substrate-binding protein [Phreatobacter sp.]
MRSLFRAAALSATLTLSLLSSAFALDTRYRDTDGDLVADIPAAAEQVDPAVLIFAYTPVEDPSVYARVWDSFLQHMSRVTGKRVQFFPVQSNAAQIEALRAGRLHVAGFNTGSTPLAVNCAGFRPLFIMAANDGDFGYRMQFITHPGSGVEKMEDIRGRRIAFTSETSNSGYKAPSALLRDAYRLEANRDFTPVFSGRHDNSVLGVANRDYPVAAIASEVARRMVARNVVRADAFRVIYESDRFPTTAYGVAHNLRADLQDKIREAFATFPWAGTALAEEFGKTIPAGERFMPITYRDAWKVVRDVDASVGVQYTCR